MDINQYGGKVVLFSGNQDLDAHYTHKQKWCYQFNDTTLEYAKTWWLAHHQPTLKEETDVKEDIKKTERPWTKKIFITTMIRI